MKKSQTRILIYGAGVIDFQPFIRQKQSFINSIIWFTFNWLCVLSSRNTFVSKINSTDLNSQYKNNSKI